MKDELRCPHCGDLIGVYEPLIRMTNGRPEETSRAAHPNPGAAGVQCFHRECYREGPRPCRPPTEGAQP